MRRFLSGVQFGRLLVGLFAFAVLEACHPFEGLIVNSPKRFKADFLGRLCPAFALVGVLAVFFLSLAGESAAIFSAASCSLRRSLIVFLAMSLFPLKEGDERRAWGWFKPLVHRQASKELSPSLDAANDTEFFQILLDAE